MSGAQEERKAGAWESQHRAGHEQRVAALREKKAILDGMSQDAPEYARLKADYDTEYADEEAFLMKFHP